MADTKLTDLAAASTLDGTEVVYGVQSSSNVKITTLQIKTYANGISRSINSVSSGGTLGSVANTDYVYLASGTNTQTLPTAVGNTNRYTVKNSGTGVITIATTSSQTIDGALTLTLATPNMSVDLISDNANWWIV